MGSWLVKNLAPTARADKPFLQVCVLDFLSALETFIGWHSKTPTVS
ncbi:MAG: hypothetical protein AABX79_01360 [Nanoarchaeota archaeon]